MRPVILTLTGNGATAQNSNPVVMDQYSTPFNIGLGLVTSSQTATTTFTVQHTFDDPASYATAALYNSSATWFNHPFIAASTANEDGNYAYPVRAVRLHCSNSGTDTGVLTVIQAGLR